MLLSSQRNESVRYLRTKHILQSNAPSGAAGLASEWRERVLPKDRQTSTLSRLPAFPWANSGGANRASSRLCLSEGGERTNFLGMKKDPDQVGKKARELYNSFFYPWPFAARSSAPPHLASPRQSAETEACPPLDFCPLLGRCLFTKDSLFSSTTLFLPFLLHSFFV